MEPTGRRSLNTRRSRWIRLSRKHARFQLPRAIAEHSQSRLSQRFVRITRKNIYQRQGPGKACPVSGRQSLPLWSFAATPTPVRTNLIRAFSHGNLETPSRISTLVGMARNFKDLTEREILALAISLEEEDGRVYGDFAEGLRETYPATAKLFDDMGKEESEHRASLF